MHILREYYGTKKVNAKSMTRGEYNDLRGWEIPENENPSDLGYLVEYPDSAQGNGVSGFAGYVSWSPAEVFEKSYTKNHSHTFGHALEALKSGHRVARSGWNGRGMWLSLVPGSTITVAEGRPLARVFTPGVNVEYLPHIDMYTVDGKMVPWLASQTDLLAADWMILL